MDLEKLLILASTKTIIKALVDFEEVDIFIQKTNITKNMYIPEGIYKAKNWFSFILVTNTSSENETLLLESPLKVSRFTNHNFIEVNNFNTNQEATNDDMEIVPHLWLNHLNKEKRKELVKVCRKVSDIFFKEGQTLTFLNQIKHRVKTTDEIVIHRKSYRYPYVHKEEVRRKINEMLE